MSPPLPTFPDLINISTKIFKIPKKQATLFLLSLTVAFYFGRAFSDKDGIQQDIKQNQIQEQNINVNNNNDNKKGSVQGIEDTNSPLEPTIFDQAVGDWDLRSFYKEGDGYFCPRETSKQKYYYAWYKPKISLLGTSFIKFQTKASSVSDGNAREAVVKFGKEYEYSEFYLPTREKETIQYKQRENLEDGLHFQMGKEISTPIKINEPIEIEVSHQVADGNRIEPDYTITYLSNNKGILLIDPLSYQPFSINETNPKDVHTDFGFGVDRYNCFQIIKYCFSTSCRSN